MPLSTKSFDQIVNLQVNAMQSQSSQPLDFTVGSIFRACVESNAGNSLWLQGLITYVLSVARLQTSYGTDADTFVQQFGLTRNPATPAYGIATFSRFTPTYQATIKAGSFDKSSLGAIVSAVANGIDYSVYADTSNINYDPEQNAYIIPAGISSIDVPVVALTNGSVGNVLANQITTIDSIILNVDSVNNSSSFVNGTDRESNESLKIRFVLYLNSLSKATKNAIDSAVLGVPGVVREKSVENEDVDGNPYVGFFYVVIDDGTGSASPELLGNVQDVVYNVRGLTIAFSVYAPIAFPISVSATVYTDGSIPDSDVQSDVENALISYINQQSFDSLFPYSKVPDIIYDANSSILNVTNYSLNLGTSDIQLIGREIMIPGALNITVTQ